jgi:hypothetical protein
MWLAEMTFTKGDTRFCVRKRRRSSLKWGCRHWLANPQYTFCILQRYPNIAFLASGDASSLQFALNDRLRGARRAPFCETIADECERDERALSPWHDKGRSVSATAFGLARRRTLRDSSQS